MDAVGPAELDLRALTLEHFQDEVELELWSIGFGLLLGHVLPFFLFGEKIAPPSQPRLWRWGWFESRVAPQVG
jgi:hypothetical protein